MSSSQSITPGRAGWPVLINIQLPFNVLHIPEEAQAGGAALDPEAIIPLGNWPDPDAAPELELGVSHQPPEFGQTSQKSLPGKPGRVIFTEHRLMRPRSSRGSWDREKSRKHEEGLGQKDG